jgi:fructose-bisphosphate aldolase/6-deoxy-5-ketofructose 1-phosphate synthase
MKVPLSVPANKLREYKKNFKIATKGTGRLLLFAGDQKIEHLNGDFFGAGIDIADRNPKHLFEIAAKSAIGAFAVQLGLIARYGQEYRHIPYIVKVNSKTNLLQQENPLSANLCSVADVVRFQKQNRLNIVGVGYTLYLGNEFEPESLAGAAQTILEAHQNGLLAVIWIYTRGKDIKNEKDIHLIAGAAGVGASLGADFIKLIYPYTKDKKTATKYKEVIEAAGLSRVICVGGTRQKPKEFLDHVYNQINIAGTKGLAVGRNLHQLPLNEAIRLAESLSAIINYGANSKDAYSIYLGKLKMKK